MASYNGERPGTITSCSTDTRVRILEDIEGWITKPEGDNIYWLAERAGFGKTAIALSIAERAAERGDLAASFFFSYQVPELRTASRFFPTLAFQLSLFDDRVYRKHFVEAVDNAPDAGATKLEHQAKALFIDPLQRAAPLHRPMVIVVDALDECNREHAQELVVILTKALQELSLPIRFFITSRPEHHIITAFEAAGISSRAVVDSSEQDVETFLRKELPTVPRKLGLRDMSHWISEHEIRILASRAGGLFIYAAVVLGFLTDLDALDPREHLDVLLQEDESQVAEHQPYEALDRLYLRVLKVATNDKPQYIKEVRTILGIAIVVKSPLPLSWLEYFAYPAVKNIHRTLNKLRSVIALDPTSHQGISFHHASFKDFLLISSRSSAVYFIDRAVIHHHLALRFLDIISQSPSERELEMTTVSAGSAPKLLDCDEEMLQHAERTVFVHIHNSPKDTPLIHSFDKSFHQGNLISVLLKDRRYESRDVLNSYRWRASSVTQIFATHHLFSSVRLARIILQMVLLY